MKCWVATRKGLIPWTRGSSGWSAGDAAFLGDPVTAVLKDPRDGALWAGLNLGHFGVKLRVSEDGGKQWEEVDAPSYADVGPEQAGEGSNGNEDAGPSLQLIWAIESGGPERAGRLWAGTIPGGLFRSDDRGKNWTLMRGLWDRPERAAWFGGGYDQPGIHSVCVDPRDPDVVRVGVSCGGVWRSDDAGETWRVTTQGMFAEYMPPEQREQPEIQDPHRMVQCPASPDVLWVQHHNGAFRSTDGGETWASLDVPPSTFGFAVAVHPHEPTTAWFVPGVKDECRVPVDARLTVARTRDGGQSFESIAEGLPDGASYDLVYRHALDVSEDGRTLAFGSTTGNLWISENGGDSWDLASAHLPPIYAVRFAS